MKVFVTQSGRLALRGASRLLSLCSKQRKDDAAAAEVETIRAIVDNSSKKTSSEDEAQKRTNWGIPILTFQSSANKFSENTRPVERSLRLRKRYTNRIWFMKNKRSVWSRMAPK